MLNNSKHRRIEHSRPPKRGGAGRVVKLASRRALAALLAIGLLAAGVAGFFMSDAVAQAQDAEATAPGAPTNLRVDGSLVNNPFHDGLAWDAPDGDGGAGITGYRLERRATSSGDWETPEETGPTDTAFKYQKSIPEWFTGYVYRVRAVNSVGQGPWSNELTVGGVPTWTLGTDGAPTATPHATLPRVTLDWTGKLSNDGGKPIITWTWYWRKSSDSPIDWEEGGNVAPGQTVSTAVNLEYNTEYVFRVQASNGHRYRFSSNAEATTVVSSAPTELRVTDVSHISRDSLAWTAPSEEHGAAVVTGYELQRRRTDSSKWDDPVNTGSTNTAYTVTKEGWGFGYSYRVRGVSGRGDGPWSNELTVGGRPAWKSGAAGTPTATPHATLPQITLDWTGKLSNDGGKPVTKWRWRMKKASSNDFVWKDELPAEQTSVIATGLEFGATYDFDVIAYNEDRNSYTSLDARATTATEDRATLVKFYNATGGANWTYSGNWLSAEPLHRWSGVATDDDGRVIALDLPNNNLLGPMPAEISDLSRLQQIYVQNNERLRGPLLSSMAGLSSMKHLNTRGTGLCAPDDAALREWLDGLETANVRDCPDDLAWAVLVEFYNATDGPNWSGNHNWLSNKPLNEWAGVSTDRFGRVKRLELSDYDLKGSIPESLGSLSELRLLDLRNNELSGALPESFGNLANLEALHLQNNRLTGQLPNTLGGMKKLRILYLHNQEDENGNGGLTGSIPAEVSGITSLRELVLDRNNLSGPIPVEMGNMNNLRRFAANRNEITGSIPVELGNMRQLQVLGLGNNDLSGTLPSELGNLKQLARLSLHDNTGLSGTLPSGFVNMDGMQRLAIANTGLCAPNTDAFSDWLADVPDKPGGVNTCE